MTEQQPEESLPPAAAAPPAKAEKDDATELLKAMAVAAVIALFIRSFLFEPFNIPSSSMYPNLMVGDYLFVKKWSYGYSQYSFPLGLIPFKGRIMASPAKRGDIIVFRQPKRAGIDYIKRLVGMPGDRIRMQDGRLYLNGELIPREPKGSESRKVEEGERIFNKYLETLPGDKAGDEPVKHYIYEVSDNEPYDNTPEFTVPEGHYFMMGDNRDRSLDSRTDELGFVPEENFIGPASFMFFSIGDFSEDCSRDGILGAVKATGCKIGEVFQSVRYSRIFRRVHALD